MGQRAQRQGDSPSSRARTRVGATVAPFLIRTPEEAEHVWPLPEAILPADTIEQLPLKKQHLLLAAFRRNSALAYRCLRWARWMAPNRKLKVTCLKCRRRTAWSHTAVSQRLRDGTYRLDGGKWRWICHKQCTEPEGCKGRFFDTTQTPFCHARVPPGVVFAALAYSPGVIQRLLRKTGQIRELRELQTVLKDVKGMRARKLRRRLKQYARLFCGTVLLRDCRKLTRSFDGVQALEARLRSLHSSQVAAAEPAIRQRQASYAALKKLVNDLQKVDHAPPRLRHRKRLWKKLQGAVRTLCEPITPVPVNLQALLAEASLSSPS